MSASELTVRRQRKVVLDGLSCEVTGTGVAAVVGVNGSGKSTFLQTLGGLLRPSAGTLEILGIGVDRTTRRQLRGRVGYAEQSPQFASERGTVLDALNYSAWLHRLPKSSRARHVDRVTELFDLDEIRSERVGHLSGGTRQRLMLALSVLHEPELVLLDESTSGVDVEHRASVRDTLKEIATTSRVIMSTHVAEDVLHLADDVIGIHRGMVTFQGSKQDFLELGNSSHESQFESALVALASSEIQETERYASLDEA